METAAKLTRLTSPFVMILLLLASCSGAGDKPQATATRQVDSAVTPNGTALHQDTVTPMTTPLVAGPDIRLCQGDDIASIAGPNGAGGFFYAFITLSNRSSTACQLKQLPEIELLDSQGNRIAIDVTQNGPCQGGFSCVMQRPLLLLPSRTPSPDYPPRQGEVPLRLAWRYTDDAGAECAAETPKATDVKLGLVGTSSSAVVNVSELSPHHGIVVCNGRILVVNYGVP
jgi:hypothetical protein